MRAFFSRQIFYVPLYFAIYFPFTLVSASQNKETPAELIDKARTSCQIANQIINEYQHQERKKVSTKEDLLHFLSTLSADAFIDIMAMQTRGFKAMGNVLKGLVDTSQTRYIPLIKKKFEMSIAERDDNSKVHLEVFNSQEGQAIVQQMLQAATRDKLQQMLAAIEEQKEQYAVVNIKMPKYIRAVYDAWELAIKKRLAEIRI